MRFASGKGGSDNAIWEWPPRRLETAIAESRTARDAVAGRVGLGVCCYEP